MGTRIALRQQRMGRRKEKELEVSQVNTEGDVWEVHDPKAPLTEILAGDTAEEEGHVQPNVKLPSTSTDARSKRCAYVRERPKRAAAITAVVAIFTISVLAARKDQFQEFVAGLKPTEVPTEVPAEVPKIPIPSQELYEGKPIQLLRSNECGGLSQNPARWNALKCDCLALSNSEQAASCYVSKAVPLAADALEKLSRGAGEAGAGGRGSAMHHTTNILSFGTRVPGDSGWRMTQVLRLLALLVQKYKY